jgi:AraC-like DNA-binding protein
MPAVGRQEAGERPRSRAAAVTDATCSVRIIQPFAKWLISNGHDIDALLADHGLSLAALRDRDLRIRHTTAMSFVSRAVTLSGDAAIGVRASRCEQQGDFDVIEYAAASCATMGEAMRLAARFIALMHDGISLEVDVAPPLAALRVRVVPGLYVVPASIEFLFASLLEYGGRFVGRRMRPLRIDFAHSGAPSTAYDETFREVRFDAPEHCMWFPAVALDLPHQAPDSSLLQILTSHADGLLRQLSPRAPSFAERVRQAIADELSAGNPGAENVARRLAVSLRTLHRRLAEEQTSHRELMDDVRRAQAMLHLASTRFSIGEISFILGFAHPNAFHKAFKRWTGMTPAQAREQAHGRLTRR